MLKNPRMPFLTLALSSGLFLGAISAPAADERGEQLLAATRKGDLAAVKKLLDEGADVNARTRYQSTPLFFACDRGHLEIARLLIERGADVNVKDNFYNASALTWAMSKKHEPLVSLLIEKGADVSEALYGSIQGGDTALFGLILEKGKLTQATLDEALLAATVLKNDKNAGMAKQLEDKGAKAIDFPVDEATLKGYEGKFAEGDANLTFSVKEGKLNVVTPQASTPVVPVAKDRFKWVQNRLEFIFERDGQGSVSGLRFASRGGDMKLKRVN